MKPVTDMNMDEVSSAILQLGKLKKLDPDLRGRYMELVDAGEEEHEMIEISPGRSTKSWSNAEQVLAVLVDISECMEVPLVELVKPVAPGALATALKKRKIDMPPVLSDSIESKQGDPFTRIKPQTDPELFRD